MGRITRRQQITIPCDYWESSLNIDWIYIDA